MTTMYFLDIILEKGRQMSQVGLVVKCDRILSKLEQLMKKESILPL